jgi:hypothetical protein
MLSLWALSLETVTTSGSARLEFLPAGPGEVSPNRHDEGQRDSEVTQDLKHLLAFGDWELICSSLMTIRSREPRLASFWHTWCDSLRV